MAKELRTASFKTLVTDIVKDSYRSDPLQLVLQAGSGGETLFPPGTPYSDVEQAVEKAKAAGHRPRVVWARLKVLAIAEEFSVGAVADVKPGDRP